MVLQPLEFIDCLTASPQFRENLHCHEKELLGTTSKCIKSLISDLKEVETAHKNVTKAHNNLAKTLSEFHFETIDSRQTDDERNIGTAFKKFADNLRKVEQEREKMLEVIHGNCLVRLEEFKREEIGQVKEGKKRFDKLTEKYCRQVERHVGANVKKYDPSTLHEMDQLLEIENRDYTKATMEYVLMLHGLQEKKKFEFVEIMLGFVYQQMVFLHLGYEHAQDFKPAYTDLQIKLQKTRENFGQVTSEAGDLMKKMMENQQDYLDKEIVKQGYLYMLEKQPFRSAWAKHYTMYDKDSKKLTFIPFNQVVGKPAFKEVLSLKSCTRRASESIDRRFCFDIEVAERQQSITLQALSEDGRKEWLTIMDGREPNYKKTPLVSENLCCLNDVGMNFVAKCIAAVEERAMNDEGVYRLAGVNSRIQRLISQGLDPQLADKLDLANVEEFDVKTLTSALKYYFRHLPEPIMTFDKHNKFIQAAQLDSLERRVLEIHTLIHALPHRNFLLLSKLIAHLSKLVANEQRTRMTSSNMAVVWGPSLMRRREETVAAIMDIKFCNIVIEILIDNKSKVFDSSPEGEGLRSVKVLPKTLATSAEADHASPNRGLVAAAPPTLADMDDFLLDAVDPVPAQLEGVNLVSNRRALFENTGKPADSSYREARQGLRPGTVYHPTGTVVTGGGSPRLPLDANSEGRSLSSASNDSLASRSTASSAQVQGKRPVVHPAYSGLANDSKPPSSMPSNKELFLQTQNPNQQTQNVTSSSLSSNTDSSFATAGKSSPVVPRRARTLYVCEAENDQELSFVPNEVLLNVVPSREPGWMSCTLNGKDGLVPQNYIEFLD